MTSGDSARWRRRVLVAGGIGLAACALGATIDVRAVAEGYFAAAMFWLNVALGGVTLLLVHQLTGGAWGRALAPVLGALGACMPWAGLLFLPLLFACGLLFPWAGAHPGPAAAQKAAWLNLPFFAVRTVVELAALSALGVWAAQAARAGASRPRLASAGLLLYALTITLFAVDWVVSREPRWYTTSAGFVLAGAQFAAALAFAGLAVSLPAAGDGNAGASRAPLQDVGNLLLAALLFLAYVAFMEFLIIWQGDLPDEIVWFVRRSSGVWPFVAISMVLLQFAVPFALLLSRSVKRSARGLAAASAIALAGSATFAVWLAGPGTAVSPLRWLFLPAALAGIGGVGGWFFLGALAEGTKSADTARAGQPA